MKLTFLGVSGLLADGHNSNMLLECSNKCLLIDCGDTIKQALKDAGRNVYDIDAVYISHLHSDHCHGLQWLGYYSYFLLKRKLQLFIHESLVDDLWSILSPGMSKLSDKSATLSDYFIVNVIKDRSGQMFNFSDNIFRLKRMVHVDSPCGIMYSFALIVDSKYSYGREKAEIFISSDTKEVSASDSMFIFYDCDFLNLHGVHADYDLLNKLPDNIKRKTWLYHHHNDFDKMPDVINDGFAGVVKQGQIFII